MNERRKQYYIKNREKIIAKSKAWAKANPEKKREYFKKYAKTHSKENSLKSILWRKNNYERYKIARRKRENNPIFFLSAKRIYKTLKTNSKRRKMDIPLTQEEFVKWYMEVPKNCCYCGVDEETLFKNEINRFDIERIDNMLPYQINNIALACRMCNKVKSNILTSDEMKFIGMNIIIKKWKI